MKRNYIIYAFVGGKCAGMYDAINLDTLVVVIALHKDCTIEICDVHDSRALTQNEITDAITASRLLWGSGNYGVSEETISSDTEQEPKTGYQSKNWKKVVLCIETGQTYSSMRECSAQTHIPYMTIANCIKNRNATRGMHFVQIDDTKENNSSEI